MSLAPWSGLPELVCPGKGQALLEQRVTTIVVAPVQVCLEPDLGLPGECNQS